MDRNNRDPTRERYIVYIPYICGRSNPHVEEFIPTLLLTS